MPLRCDQISCAKPVTRRKLHQDMPRESGQHFRQLYCPLPWHDTVFSCPEIDALDVKAQQLQVLWRMMARSYTPVAGCWPTIDRRQAYFTITTFWPGPQAAALVCSAAANPHLQPFCTVKSPASGWQLLSQHFTQCSMWLSYCSGPCCNTLHAAKTVDCRVSPSL